MKVVARGMPMSGRAIIPRYALAVTRSARRPRVRRCPAEWQRLVLETGFWLRSRVMSNDADGVVELVHAESGPGQFEIPVRYTDALAAADQQVMVRETVKAIAQQHGLIASFLPKIRSDLAGSGAHLHFSLWQEGQRSALSRRS